MQAQADTAHPLATGVIVRAATTEDADSCGRIFYDAFESILVPSRNAELLRRCLEHGMRIVQQSTLMTIGLYHEPAGAYLPSILF
jgi:hypothetical protein